jgi:REP-associated tyrosine transposase
MGVDLRACFQGTHLLLYLRVVPRRPRHLLGDGTFHITARGVARSEIFLDERDYRAFLGLLRDAVNRFAWRTRAFCLMPNHFHLVVSTTRIELSAGMHRLNCLYAMRFNKRYKRSGHLFQNRFDARIVEGDRHAQAVARYVVDNPVRAGLCQDWRHWPWSGLGGL